MPDSLKGAPNDALDYIFKYYKNFPFWAQLPQYSKEEHMLYQFLEGAAGFEFGENTCFDTSLADFSKQVENINKDFNAVIIKNDLNECTKILDRWALLPPYSSTFSDFTKKVKSSNIKLVKGHTTGAFTVLTSLFQKNGHFAYENEILKEIVPKVLILRALWQLKELKNATGNGTCVIFIDEPSISKIESSKIPNLDKNDATVMIEKILEPLKKFGAKVGVHCCSNALWDLVFKANPDIISLDAFCCFENFFSYSKYIKKFLENGGIIAFGMVPTQEPEVLSTLSVDELFYKFNDIVQKLMSLGFLKCDIIEKSMITTSCGCGLLNKDMAKRAMGLTVQLSDKLKQNFEVNL